MSERKEWFHGMRPTTAILTKGFDPRLSVGSARPAVFRSSTYVFSSPEAAERAFAVAGGCAKAREGEHVELIYSRINHPNAEIVEEQIVPLEKGAQAAAVCNSGMAAIMTALGTFLRPGQSVIYTVPLYGGSQLFMHKFLEPFGMRTVPVVAGDGAALDAAIAAAPNLGAIFIETPSNPTMVMTDIRRAANTAARRALVVVDNTFLGPTSQHPLMLGADLVVYSATKYLSGFSDMLAGVLLARDPALIQAVRASRVMFGNILQPDECWMLEGRLPTVALRMNKQSKNAQRIAERLAKHPRVEHMHYPTLFEDPEQVRIRDAQCDFPGAVFSMELRGGRPAAFDFLRGLHLVSDAVSLGGVETLACHPKTTTHSVLSEEELRIAGITDSLVRVSVGVEHWRDLLADFEQALDAI
jgi:cystathionine beta-lyase/cystathionine gamma-synthase